MLCFLIHLFILIMFNVGVFCFFFPRRIEICANSSPLFAHASKVHIQKKKKCIYFFWYDAEKAVDTAKLFIFLVYKYNKKLFSFMSNKRNLCTNQRLDVLNYNRRLLLALLLLTPG